MYTGSIMIFTPPLMVGVMNQNPNCVGEAPHRMLTNQVSQHCLQPFNVLLAQYQMSLHVNKKGMFKVLDYLQYKACELYVVNLLNLAPIF